MQGIVPNEHTAASGLWINTKIQKETTLDIFTAPRTDLFDVFCFERNGRIQHQPRQLLDAAFERLHLRIQIFFIERIKNLFAPCRDTLRTRAFARGLILAVQVLLAIC